MPTLEEDFQVLPDQFPHGAEPAKSERSLDEDFEPVMQPQEAAQMGIDAVNNINSILSSPAVAAASQAAQEEANAPEVKLKLTPYEQLRLSAPQGMPQMGPFGPTGGQFGEVIAPPIQSVAELKGAAQTAKEALAVPGKGLVALADIPTRIHNIGVPRESPAYVEPLAERNKEGPIISFPRFAPVDNEGAWVKALEGIANTASETGTGFIGQPESGFMLPLFSVAGPVTKAATTLFGAEQFADLPAEAKRSIETLADPKADLSAKVEAVASPVVRTALAAAMVRAGYKAPTEPFVPPRIIRPSLPGGLRAGIEPPLLPAEPVPPRPPLGGELPGLPPGARPPVGSPPEPLQTVSPEQAAAQAKAMQRRATAAIEPPRLPKPSVPSGPGEPPAAPVPPQPAPPAPPEIQTWDDAVAALSARGTGSETRAQVQAMFPQLKLTRETARDLAKAAFGDEWKPGGEAPQPPPPKAAAQPPPVPTLPVPAEGTVRLYHGEGGAGGAGFSKVYWSDNPEYAARYGPNVEYVDVPANVAEAARKSAQAQGIGTPGAHELPDEWVRKARQVAAASPTAHEVERPEVAKLGPQGGRLNPYGDPAGTVYHATPEDWTIWQDIQARMRSAKAAGDTATYFRIAAETQPFQKRYGGMPPAPPKSGETAPLRATKENPGPHRLVPTLVVNGKRFYGTSHAEALKAASFAGEDAFDVYGNDANHVFEDENGNLLNRQQATERYKELTGEKMEGGLHSENLPEAWKVKGAAAPPVPTPAAKPAGPEPEWLGKPLSYWDNVAENLPHRDERARLAKSMGVPNQPAKIANHIRRRVAEIRANPPTPPKAAEPVNLDLGGGVSADISTWDDAASVSYRNESGHVGSLEAERLPNGKMAVENHSLAEDVRGQGYGQKVIEYLASVYGEILSDEYPSEAASKMWERLGAKKQRFEIDEDVQWRYAYKPKAPAEVAPTAEPTAQPPAHPATPTPEPPMTFTKATGKGAFSALVGKLSRNELDALAFYFQDSQRSPGDVSLNAAGDALRYANPERARSTGETKRGATTSSVHSDFANWLMSDEPLKERTDPEDVALIQKARDIIRQSVGVTARAPAPPAAPQPAPPTLETSPTGELIPTEATPRTGAAARAYIIRRLEELEDIDPITGQAVPKEDLTEAQEKARVAFRAKLAAIEQELRAGAPQPKPTAPATKAPVPATKPPRAATPAPPAPTPPAKPPQPTTTQRNPNLEEAQRKYEQAKEVTAAARQKWEASEERGEHSPLYKQLQIAEAAERTAGGELAILRASIEGHAAGSQVQPEPSEPTVTSKILVEQKENLLGQVDAALKNAGKGPEKITFVVPGDGDFTILNNENSLKRFRNIAESYFPETVPTKKGSRSPNLKAPSPPKPAKASDIPKIVGQFASEDEKRPAIQHVYSDGTQMVATDGRRLLRFVGTTPGTPAAPVRLTPEGKVDAEAVERFPNYNQVRPTNVTLAKGGADSAALWKLARQASAFRKTFKEGTVTDAVTLYLNSDGSFGMRSEPQPGETFESNVKPNAVNLGDYNAQYLADGLDAARRLGSEKIDIYVDGETGPLVLQGQNWEYLLMGMKKEGPFLRDDPAKYSAALAGQSAYPRLPEGLSPLRSPEEFNARQTGSFNVIYENGKFRVQHERKVGGGMGQKARSEWTDVAEIAFNGKDAPKPNEINDAAKVGMDRDLTKDERASIQAAAKQLLSDRQKVIDEAKERQNISVGPGAASPAEFEQRPDPEVVNLAIGSPALARLTRQYQNFFNGIRQLFARRGAKRDMMSLMNAANGLADVAGLRAGKAISARATSPEALRALTFVIQALKMSGEGLSADAEERLGQLEFAGDPEGYLRTKQADMETAAQQFAQNGQAVEAHAAKAAAEAMLYARQHFNQLRPAADRFRQITDRQHARLANAGIDVAYENWYVPQRHDLDMFTGADRPIVLGHGGSAGGSTQFKKAKTFEDYASAIEAGFVPRSLSANELLHHYVSTTERLITTKAFFDGLRGVTDPVDGKAVVTNVPRKVIQRADGSIDVQETVPLGYTVHQVAPGVRLAVHNGYSRLIDALTARSQLAQSAAFGTLQDIAAFEKHIGLALDTFHASRVMQTELAMTGKLSVGARQRLGRALVEYSPADLDAAVQAGEITQEMADFIRRPQEMQVNGKTMKLSPANVFILGLRNGLNVGRFADVIYRQWLRDIPGVGQINRWVFDKQTRAATANGFAAEFERVAAARPDLTANEVARTVARDVNVLFGNLQKESIFRNPSLRTILQVVFLAPEWVQGMARREGRAPLQLAQAGVALAKGEPVHLGTAARTMGRGIAAYIIGTQVLNLITRHQLTFYNQERGHKLDAWVPIGKHGFFLSPLSVFGEITHDLIRLAETKPDFASVLTQIGANKLGNIGRAIGIIATGRDPFTGDKIIGTSRRAMRAALQLVPTPITISQPLQAAGAALGVARPPQEGAVARQVVSSLGFKTEPAPTPGQQVYQLAQSWMRTASPRMQADAQRRLQEDFGPSDYRDLRSALAKDDLAGARKAYQALRQQGKTPKQIRQTIQHPHPFTGSATGERQFRASLSPEDRKLYDQAVQERRKLYQQFQQMLNTQPR